MATWKNLIRRGKDIRTADVLEHTLLDTATEDGKTLEELKIDPELTETPWTNKTKNTATYTNTTKN